MTSITIKPKIPWDFLFWISKLIDLVENMMLVEVDASLG